ncbi:hypothetical protein NBRC116188_26280 [Oceaniserpentilla sp. 4NH20-0058]|uniref:hypothetical protein n=1 Tax=Oceaniserpentilla sp. 4NH20-0058 TaxID=3127660 RepID=UPI00310A16E0
MLSFNNLLVKGAAVAALSAAFAMPSFASTGGGDRCSVTRISGASSTFYVPSGGSGTYNILGWGNGTGGSSYTYSGVLESIAEQCIFVAAANTANSGTGREVENAVNDAKSRYSNILGSNPKVCTSGHSQGGGGSFNAANRLGADCVIAVQPDTVYTTSIYSPVASNVDVVCIFSRSDTLAPALPFNSLNCRANSTRYSEESTSGTHFTITYGDGGAPGDEMRDYAARWLK